MRSVRHVAVVQQQQRQPRVGGKIREFLVDFQREALMKSGQHGARVWQCGSVCVCVCVGVSCMRFSV